MNKILTILDDDERRLNEFHRQLSNWLSDYHYEYFDNAPEMIEWLGRHLSSISLISLDHDLGPNRSKDNEIFDPGTGRDVVDFLITRMPSCPILIHSSNAMAVTGMRFALEFAGWNASWVMPSDDLAWIELYWKTAVINSLAGNTD